MHFGKGRPTLLGIPLERMGTSPTSHIPAQKLGASKKWLSLVWPCQTSTVQGLIILGYIPLRCLKNRFRSKQSHLWDCRDFLHPHPLTSTTSRGPGSFLPLSQRGRVRFGIWSSCPAAPSAGRGVYTAARLGGGGRRAGRRVASEEPPVPEVLMDLTHPAGCAALVTPQACRLHTRLVTHRGTLRMKSSPGRIPDGGTLPEPLPWGSFQPWKPQYLRSH